ncbi:hypothetical protein Pla110_33060 [Polystyrenella longa]|uniref:Uncharacterized protein n=1 Tax=Polystyrenella longa TaxID=2528007 RepID=A0A518CQT8_9PLAN|nr:hypothetical protein [Polystyrenella longa]QDU81564.1 hypothetical protein Pla110_33060 [Polystyrenella longa]
MSAFNLGSAVYEIGANLNPLGKGLSVGKKMIGGFAKVAVAGIAAAAVGMGAALAGGIKLTQLGSDLEELDSKFQTVFGDRTADVRKWGDALASSTQRSSIQIRGMLSGFQDLFAPMGIADDQAEHMSKTMSALAIDLGSFNNRSDDSVMEDLQAAMTGSGEVMKKYGVILSESAVKQELLNQGLDPKNATEAQKSMARMNIILAGTTAAQGDAARTSDGVANSWKGLTSQIFDMASNMGKSLLPAAKLVIGVFKDLAGFFGGAESGFATFGEGLANSIGGAIDYIKGKWAENKETVSVYFTTVKSLALTVWNIISTAGVEAFTAIVDTTFTLYDTFARIVRATGLFSSGASDAGSTVTSVFDGIRSVVGTVFEYIVAGIKNVIFAFQNWDLVVEKFKIQIRNLGPNIVGALKTAGKNIVSLATWVSDNWKNIFKTIGSYVTSVFTNLIHNLKQMWQSLTAWINDENFEPDYKSLTDGFENTVSKMPEFEVFTGTDKFKQEMGEVTKEWKKRKKEFDQKFSMGFDSGNTGDNPDGSDKDPFKMEFKGFDKDALAKAGGDAGGEDEKKKSKSDAGSTTSLQGAFDKLQQAALGNDQREKENNKSLKDIAKNTEQLAKKTTKPMTQNSAVPVFQ